MVEISASFMDKVEAEAPLHSDEIAMEKNDGGVDGDRKELWPVERRPEPPDEGEPVEWPMPEFCPLAVDGSLKESFLKSLRKKAEWLQETDRSSELQPSSSKRCRAATGDARSPSAKSPYRNILEVFQQCKHE